MVFSPEKGMLYCPYCDSTRAIDKAVSAKRDFFAARKDGDVDEGSIQYDCPNCGGTITLENFETALSCPFCGGSNIVKKEMLAGLKPDSILPFTLSQEKALETGKTWVKKRIFAPSKLKKHFDADHFKGVYVPTFNFTSDTYSTYKGRLGERYTVTRRDSKGNTHTETKIRWFMVSGDLNKLFKDMIIEASTQLTQKEMGKLLPFDVVSAEEYKREYLAGFMSERYSTSLDDSFGTAKKTMDTQIRAAILSKYNADVVDYLNVDTSFRSVDFSYMLLPVWVCGYKYREKMYHFIVNGRTGKSTGKTPLSPYRIGTAVVLGIGILAALIYLIYTLI